MIHHTCSSRLPNGMVQYGKLAFLGYIFFVTFNWCLVSPLKWSPGHLLPTLKSRDRTSLYNWDNWSTSRIYYYNITSKQRGFIRTILFRFFTIHAIMKRTVIKTSLIGAQSVQHTDTITSLIFSLLNNITHRYIQFIPWQFLYQAVNNVCTHLQ